MAFNAVQFREGDDPRHKLDSLDSKARFLTSFCEPHSVCELPAEHHFGSVD